MYRTLQSLVGQDVTFTPEHGDTHHGTIRSANWNTMGEPVLIIQTDEGPAHVSSGLVLVGRDANTIISTLHPNAA